MIFANVLNSYQWNGMYLKNTAFGKEIWNPRWYFFSWKTTRIPCALCSDLERIEQAFTTQQLMNFAYLSWPNTFIVKCSKCQPVELVAETRFWYSSSWHRGQGHQTVCGKKAKTSVHYTDEKYDSISHKRFKILSICRKYFL